MKTKIDVLIFGAYVIVVDFEQYVVVEIRNVYFADFLRKIHQFFARVGKRVDINEMFRKIVKRD